MSFVLHVVTLHSNTHKAMDNQVDLIFVERLSRGDNKVFTAFYQKCRTPFFKHFIIFCKEEETSGFNKMKFKDGDMYLDDLYQMSTMRLYEIVSMGRMRASDGNIFYTNRYSVTKPLTCSLFTFLKKIGENVLKEMYKENADSGSIDIETVLRTIDEKDDDGCPDDFIDEDEEENRKLAIVKKLIPKMTEVCRKIFTALYYTEDEKKVKGVDVYAALGYRSLAAYRNQKSRCVEKFKQAFNKSLNGTDEYGRAVR